MDGIATRPRLAGLAGGLCAVLLASGVFAHVDDPKERNMEPPYDGPGWTRSGGGAASAGAFAASGIELHAWLPSAQFAGSSMSSNDCWGYVSGSGREYAMLGLQGGTGFVEITNPGSPVVLNYISGPSSTWRDIKVFGNYAYAVTEATGAGIQVFDLSDIDNGLITLVNTVNGATNTDTHNVAIDTVSGFLYRCGGGSNDGLRIYDLNADPVNPPFVAQWHDRYVHDAQVVTYTEGPYAGRQIAFLCSGFNGGWVDTGLDILDVTDKQNIVQLDRYIYPNGVYSHQGWLSGDRQYFFLGDELDEGELNIDTTTHIINVADLSNAFIAGTFTNGNSATGHNLYTVGILVFEANYTSGLRVFDASDPLNAVEIAYFDTRPSDDNVGYNGLWSNYPYFPSGTIIGSDIQNGLFVWRMPTAFVEFDYPNGQPELISPDNGATLQVVITIEGDADIEPDSETLHYDLGGGFQTAPLQLVSGNLYEAQLPAGTCGDILSYYLSVETTDHDVITSPSGAPSVVFTALYAEGVDLHFNDDFETDTGWTVTNGGGLSDGAWERGVPIGGGDRGDPPTDSDGSGQCYLTDNEDGNSDVDDGFTTLTSPVLDGTIADAILAYDRWYSNDQGGAPGEDIFEVEISDDNGASWVDLETIGPNGEGTTGGWIHAEFVIADIPGIEPTNQIRIRFTASDLGAGSVIEAGVDAVRIESINCGSATPGDVDGDGDVDFDDFTLLLASWGDCPGCPADLDGDGDVDFDDFTLLLANWS